MPYDDDVWNEDGSLPQDLIILLGGTIKSYVQMRKFGSQIRGSTLQSSFMYGIEHLDPLGALKKKKQGQLGQRCFQGCRTTHALQVTATSFVGRFYESLV